MLVTFHSSHVTSRLSGYAFFALNSCVQVYTPGALSWLCCVGLCIVGLWPCAPIPFCLTGMQDANHYCPACGVLIRRRDALD